MSILITHGIVDYTSGARHWVSFRDNIYEATKIYSPKFNLSYSTPPHYCRMFLDCSQKRIGIVMASQDKCATLRSGMLKCYDTNKKLIVKASIEDHEVNDELYFTFKSSKFDDIVRVELHDSSALVVNKTKTPAAVKKSCTSTLSTDLAKLLCIGDYADVEIHCKDGEVVKCHKILLAARSPVFKTMLDSDFKEKYNGIIKLDYMEIGIVKELLSFIYSGIVEHPQKAMELLGAADQFQIQDLKDICGELLSSTMAVDNVLEILAAADRYRLTELKTSAMALVVLNAKTLVNTPKFKEFCTECVDKQLVVDIVKAQAYKFVTTRQTLLKEPQSVLAKMFEIDSPLQPAAMLKDGSYFIDRDPKFFEIILNFLRNDKLSDDLSKTELKNLKIEASYFMLENLLGIINEKLDYLEVYRFRYCYVIKNKYEERKMEHYYSVRKSYFEDVPLYVIINYFSRGLRVSKNYPGPFQPIGTHFVISHDDIINIIIEHSGSLNVKKFIEEARDVLVAEVKRRNQCR